MSAPQLKSSLFLADDREVVMKIGKQHPKDMGATKVRSFLTHRAVERNIAVATQSQALESLVFLYREVAPRESGWIDGLERVSRPCRQPKVLTRDEVRRLLAKLPGTYRLIGQLLYGTGMRLLERLRLRAKDLDFGRGVLIVRDGTGAKDRVTMLPETLQKPLQEHLRHVRVLYEDDRAQRVAGISLPGALAAEYPRAGTEWGWQWKRRLGMERLANRPRSLWGPEGGKVPGTLPVDFRVPCPQISSTGSYRTDAIRE